MQKHMQKQGFTLIELLVVIVIIGILATISVATFSGYFKKARDAERQAFVGNAKTIIIADQVSSDTANYCLGKDGGDNTKAALEKLFTAQGYGIPAIKNNYKYYLVLNSNCSSVASEFAVLVCKEEIEGFFTGGNLTPTGTCSSDDVGTYDVGSGETAIDLTPNATS